MKKPELADKDVFNPSEAAEFYGLSRRKFFCLLKAGPLPFIAMYNNRKLIIRSEFDAFLRARPEVEEGLKNGRSPISQKA